MTRVRPIAWSVAAVSMAVLIFSASTMAQRVAAFHRDNKRVTYAFKPVNTHSFEYAGRHVTLTDEDDPNGIWNLVVRYGTDELKLRVTIPGDRRLPGLLPHEDWLRVLRFAEATGNSLDELRAKMEAGEVPDRLVIVTRTPPVGSEPGSWGEVDRKAWKFDFYEFKPTGGFDHERKSFPATKHFNPFAKKTRPAATSTQESAPEPEPAIPDHATGSGSAPTDQLQENTWEFQAALMVMPPARGPNPQFTNDGLHAMGWTLPATSLSMLAMIGSLMVAMAPRKTPASSREARSAPAVST